ncbi:hypothetical protein BDAP_000304 [Binucleata daphniae]
MPGISAIKSKIDKFFVYPLLNDSKNLCKKIILRGSIGCGKTFLIDAICLEYNFTVIKTTTEDFLENLQRAKANNKLILHITDLDTIEESKIDIICTYIEKYTGVFVVAETRKEVNKRLTKYNCFENEIVFSSLNENDRMEILDFLHKRYTNQAISTKNEHLKDIAKYLPGYTASDICKYFRNVICNALISNDTFAESHYKQTLAEMNIKIDNFTFDNIGGLEHVKSELYNSIVLPLLHTEKYKKYGLYNACGILLYGPPGCGKTLLAKAVSNIGHCNFISIKGAELISKFVGDTEKELREIFARAKQLQPCVIFFDEIDSLCQKRNNSGYNDRIVNQILTLMDGFDNKESVFVLGATNKLEHIDEAFLRPGRFDKIIHVSLPTKKEQETIFYKCIEGIETQSEIKFCYDCSGFNSADICGFVKEAKMMFLTNNIYENDKKIDQSYFDKAYTKIKNVKKELENNSKTE